jgi:hypothetical protein
VSIPESIPDPPVDQQDDDRTPQPDPETEPVPALLAGQEEYLHAEIGRHR